MQAGGFCWEGRLTKPLKHLGSLQGSAALYLLALSAAAEGALLCGHPDPATLLKSKRSHPLQYSALYFIKDIPQLFSINRPGSPQD